MEESVETNVRVPSTPTGCGTSRMKRCLFNTRREDLMKIRLAVANQVVRVSGRPASLNRLLTKRVASVHVVDFMNVAVYSFLN